MTHGKGDDTIVRDDCAVAKKTARLEKQEWGTLELNTERIAVIADRVEYGV